MDSFFFELKQKLIFVFRIIFVNLSGGEECLVCGSFCNVMPLCKECCNVYYNIESRLALRRCAVCGKTLVSEKEICLECRKTSVYKHTDTVLPLYEYRLWNKELLFKWKILGIRSLSPFFAAQIHRALELHGWNVVVPVPPRKGKIARKGWDQIEEICCFLEKRYHSLVLRLLQRNSDTVEQKTLDRSGRLLTIGKSFVVAPPEVFMKQLKKNRGVIPEEVCLLDDILTTGSTAESCATVLKEGGVKKVDVLALFTAS